MTTFTIDRPDFGRMLDELNNGYLVILTKANGASILIQDGNDRDELGEEIYRFAIRPKADAPTSHIQSLLITAEDLFNFLEGLEFTNYETLEF